MTLEQDAGDGLERPQLQRGGIADEEVDERQHERAAQQPDRSRAAHDVQQRIHEGRDEEDVEHVADAHRHDPRRDVAQRSAQDSRPDARRGSDAARGRARDRV
ncbi:MAG: hypothetical protein U0470_08960 [Anaerolineae bacterium]